ncbi:MAG: hypothetical protein WAM13_13630 [Candidatus Sulfotelmatobacter sp.]
MRDLHFVIPAAAGAPATAEWRNLLLACTTTACHPEPSGPHRRREHNAKSLPCFAEAPSEAEGEAEGTYALVDIVMNRWAGMSEANPNQQAREGTRSNRSGQHKNAIERREDLAQRSNRPT